MNCAHSVGESRFLWPLGSDVSSRVSYCKKMRMPPVSLSLNVYLCRCWDGLKIEWLVWEVNKTLDISSFCWQMSLAAGTLPFLELIVKLFQSSFRKSSLRIISKENFKTDRFLLPFFSFLSQDRYDWLVCALVLLLFCILLLLGCNSILRRPNLNLLKAFDGFLMKTSIFILVQMYSIICHILTCIRYQYDVLFAVVLWPEWNIDGKEICSGRVLIPF